MDNPLSTGCNMIAHASSGLALAAISPYIWCSQYRHTFQPMTFPTRFFLLLLSLPTLAGCFRDNCRSSRTFVQLEPIYMTASEARSGLTVEAPRAMEAPGKIYAWGPYVFLGERYKGIHVMDNSDPTNPRPIAFWNLPGNVDMAIRGQYLYADQYMDMVTFDLTNLLQPQEVCRAKGAFSLFGYDPDKGWIVDYRRTEVARTLDCSDADQIGPWFFSGGGLFMNAEAFSSATTLGSSGADVVVSQGVAGSFARFAQHSRYLYGIDNQNLMPFDLSNPACPVGIGTIPVGWNIETIFPWKDWLFIGSNDAVFIFDNSNPAQPILAQTFLHATGCDPVICDERFAYVTIRDGLNCSPNAINQLEVIDIQQLPGAEMRATYNMVNPRGLAQTPTHLFVCDDGLRVMDKTQAPTLRQVAHVKGIATWDAIYLGANLLLVVGPDGLMQFDVSNPEDPKWLSRL